MPEINKSSRHAKITGDFAEGLVLYWLSKHGFESTRVDHTGIDLIAKNTHTDELMGISVKSRSRSNGSEKDSLDIPIDNFEKVDDACAAFGCKPYFAIVVDSFDTIMIYILSKKRLLELCPMGEKVSGWKMRDLNKELYRKDNDIIIIEFNYATHRWWGKNEEKVV